MKKSKKRIGTELVMNDLHKRGWNIRKMLLDDNQPFEIQASKGRKRIIVSIDPSVYPYIYPRHKTALSKGEKEVLRRIAKKKKAIPLEAHVLFNNGGKVIEVRYDTLT